MLPRLIRIATICTSMWWSIAGPPGTRSGGRSPVATRARTMKPCARRSQSSRGIMASYSTRVRERSAASRSEMLSTIVDKDSRTSSQVATSNEGKSTRIIRMWMTEKRMNVHMHETSAPITSDDKGHVMANEQIMKDVSGATLRNANNGERGHPLEAGTSRAVHVDEPRGNEALATNHQTAGASHRHARDLDDGERGSTLEWPKAASNSPATRRDNGMLPHRALQGPHSKKLRGGTKCTWETAGLPAGNGEEGTSVQESESFGIAGGHKRTRALGEMASAVAASSTDNRIGDTLA